jgi:AAA+ ATPase superfamily predicted ATPase
MAKAHLIDRVEEQRALHALLKRPGPSMAVLYGRRRVGKTYLLQHTWPAGSIFYFAAVDGTSELNRRALLDAVARWTGVTLNERDFATWRRVFELLMEMGDKRPIVVILDEYQYLRGSDDENVDSSLAAVWETYVNRRPKGRPFVLVLCGSIVRVMERLDAADNPLHGRLEWKARLRPFDYLDAAAMTRFRSLRDRALAYAIYGGTPRYLASIDARRTLAANVAATVLAPAGAVRGQVETVIAQEHGLRDIPQYSAILNAVGGGATDRNEIAIQTGLANNFSLRERLDTLIDLNFIDAWRNFEARTTAPIRYRISDPALRFYYSVVTRYRNELERDQPSLVWRTFIARELNAYMGLVFERIAEQAYARLRQGAGLPLIREWGRWEGVDRDRRQFEIDLLARRTDGKMLSGSVKWNAKPVGIALHTAHLQMLTKLSQSGYRWAHEALAPEAILLYVAAGGFEPTFVRQAAASGMRVVAWQLEDLYAAQ